MITGEILGNAEKSSEMLSMFMHVNSNVSCNTIVVNLDLTVFLI